MFTRAIAKLEKLAERNRRAAGIKNAKADALDLEATALLEEATAATTTAGRLKELLEEPA